MQLARAEQTTAVHIVLDLDFGQLNAILLGNDCSKRKEQFIAAFEQDIAYWLRIAPQLVEVVQVAAGSVRRDNTTDMVFVVTDHHGTLGMSGTSVDFVVYGAQGVTDTTPCDSHEAHSADWLVGCRLLL